MTALLDAAVKSSAVLFIVLSAAWFLGRSSAAVRHFVLAAGLTCAALAPVLAAVVPAWRVQLPSAVTDSESPSSRAPADDPAATIGVAGPPTADAPVAPAGTPVRLVLTGPQVLIVWAAGMVGAFLSLCAGLGRLRWIARHSAPAEQRSLAVLADVAARHGLTRAPRLLQSAHPSLLVTWGVVRPTVLLPVSAPQWTSDRMRVVLDHELAHIARRDWITQIGAEVLRCVYWFNPLMWAACRRLRQESEQACDDRVLGMGHAGPAYASHLLDLARAFRASDRFWTPAAAIARPSSLERRVAAMLTDNINRRPVNLRTALAAVLLLVFITVPISSYEAFAQARFATVSGVVTDQEGGVLNDASVALTNVETKAKFEVRTNRSGYYEITPLPAGRYELIMQSPGFTGLKEEVTLSVGESRQRSATLTVSHLQETITVTANDDPVRIREAGRPVTRKPCADPAVGGCLNPPVKVKDVTPLYPTALRDRGIRGTVMLDALVDTEGRVKDLRVVSAAHPELEQLAVDAVRAWEFTPTYLNGRTIEVQFNTGVYFGVEAPKPSPRP